jgi:hypothetical protein
MTVMREIAAIWRAPDPTLAEAGRAFVLLYRDTRASLIWTLPWRDRWPALLIVLTIGPALWGVCGGWLGVAYALVWAFATARWAPLWRRLWRQHISRCVARAVWR